MCMSDDLQIFLAHACFLTQLPLVHLMAEFA